LPAVKPCPHCGEVFNSFRAFDLHRVGSFTEVRVCLTPAQLTAKGMRKNAQGFWLSLAADGKHIKP